LGEKKKWPKGALAWIARSSEERLKKMAPLSFNKKGRDPSKGKRGAYYYLRRSSTFAGEKKNIERVSFALKRGEAAVRSRVLPTGSRLAHPSRKGEKSHEGRPGSLGEEKDVASASSRKKKKNLKKNKKGLPLQKST